MKSIIASTLLIFSLTAIADTNCDLMKSEDAKTLCKQNNDILFELNKLQTSGDSNWVGVECEVSFKNMAGKTEHTQVIGTNIEKARERGVELCKANAHTYSKSMCEASVKKCHKI